MSGCDLQEADLELADVHRAITGSADLLGANLKDVRATDETLAAAEDFQPRKA